MEYNKPKGGGNVFDRIEKNENYTPEYKEKHTYELMVMIAGFLFGDADAKEFSYGFPARLTDVYEAFYDENPALCDLLEDEMPEICGYFDVHETGSRFTYPEDAFRAKVMEVYLRAVSLATVKKVS